MGRVCRSGEKGKEACQFCYRTSIALLPPKHQPHPTTLHSVMVVAAQGPAALSFEETRPSGSRSGAKGDGAGPPEFWVCDDLKERFTTNGLSVCVAVRYVLLLDGSVD